MNYKNERGIVGKWKGYEVYIVEAADYVNKNDDIIYVIADDDMKMVKNGQVIGNLSASGSVSAVKPYAYSMPVKPVKLPDEEWKGSREAMDEISFETSIPSGYFDTYASAVNKFFEELNAG